MFLDIQIIKWKAIEITLCNSFLSVQQLQLYKLWHNLLFTRRTQVSFWFRFQFRSVFGPEIKFNNFASVFWKKKDKYHKNKERERERELLLVPTSAVTSFVSFVLWPHSLGVARRRGQNSINMRSSSSSSTLSWPNCAWLWVSLRAP